MQIYDVPSDRNYWVVRADSGTYYDHFIKFGVIAVGHLNKLKISPKDNENFCPDFDKLKVRVGLASQELSKRQESVNINQLKNFIYDMKEGDWVITVGHSSIRFGLIQSNPYIKNEPLTIYHDEEKNSKTEMDFRLRRQVAWGPSIKRSLIPYGLLSSLKANQTLFNVDKHWEAIYHTLYPAFTKENQLYLSLKIKTENDINNYSIVQILSFLNEIEVIAKEFNINLTSADIEEFKKEYAINDLYTLTTKASFHSPGDIWAKIDFSKLKKPKIVHAVLIYAMIFGNSHTGMDGILDLQSRQKLWNLVTERLEAENMDKTVEKLELSKPTLNTAKLESKDVKGKK